MNSLASASKFGLTADKKNSGRSVRSSSIIPRFAEHPCGKYLYANLCFWGFTLNPKLCLVVEAASKGVVRASIVHTLETEYLNLEE